MNVFKQYIAILLLTISSSLLQAQDLTIKASIDTNHILIGDPVNLTLQITKPLDFDIDFPELKDTITEKIEILNSNLTDTVDITNNKITLQKKYIVSCYDSGQFVIPPLPFVYQQDTVKDTIFTTPIALICETLPVDTAKKEIKDIKKPLEAPFTFQEFIKYYLPYILAGIIFALLLFFAYKYYIKHKQNKQEKPKKVYIPKEAAHIVALRQLDTLKDKKLWQNEQIKQYYSELTDILRTYLENRFRISAMEQTTYDIISLMKQKKITPQEEINTLSYVLEYGDLAKFAKYKPLPNENDKCLKNAYLFVEQTKLIEKDKQETPKDVNNNHIPNSEKQ